MKAYFYSYSLGRSYTVQAVTDILWFRETEETQLKAVQHSL